MSAKAKIAKPSKIKILEFWSLVQAESLLALARGLVSIFVPIYLWQLGYRLVPIALFFAVERVTRAATIPLAGWLSYKFGPQRILATSYPLQVAFYIIMANFHSLHLPYAIPAVVLGVSLAFYWVGYHIDLSLSRGKHDHGRDLGTVQAISRAVAIIAPVSSGFLATHYGFTSVFWVAAFAALTASALVWRQPEPWRERRLKFREVLRPRIIMHSLDLALGALQTAFVAVAWPLYVFLVVGSFEEVGLAATIAAVGPVLALWAISRLATQQNRAGFFRFGQFTSAMVHVVRTIITTLTGAIGLSIVDGLVSPAMDIPLQATFYHRLKQLPRIEYVVVEEVTNSVVCLAGWSILAIIASHTEPKTALHFIFILAAAATLAVNVAPSSKFKRLPRA